MFVASNGNRTRATSLRSRNDLEGKHPTTGRLMLIVPVGIEPTTLTYLYIGTLPIRVML